MTKINQILIAAADSLVNGKGSHEKSNAVLRKVKEKGIPVLEYIIDPLKAGWERTPQKNHFQSGCAPLFALQKAVNELKKRPNQCIIIKGRDFLKSEYESSQRRDLMRIYGNMEIYKAYDLLAQKYIKRIGISPDDFKKIAKALFENYKQTFLSKYQSTFSLPSPKWYNYVSPLFRGVDCANPVIDFSGQLIIVSSSIMEKLNLENKRTISIKAISTEVLDFDGPEYITQLAQYDHLKRVYDQTLKKAGIDFHKLFFDNKILMELYTCFPVVPIAFLMETGLANSLNEIMDIIEKIPLTITGGMNLGRAPWNNPILNSIIHIYKELQKDQIGACHGNGGLGYAQGFCLLETYQ